MDGDEARAAAWGLECRVLMEFGSMYGTSSRFTSHILAVRQIFQVSSLCKFWLRKRCRRIWEVPLLWVILNGNMLSNDSIVSDCICNCLDLVSGRMEAS
jgi:hypothetical protein